MYDRKLKQYFEVCNLKNVHIIFYNNILIVLHSTFNLGLYDSDNVGKIRSIVSCNNLKL